MKTIKIEKIDNTLPSKFINNEGLHVAVTNAMLGSELQQMSEYFAPRLTGNMNMPTEPYYLGMCGGIEVYIDPLLSWDNTIITLCENINEYDNTKL